MHLRIRQVAVIVENVESAAARLTATTGLERCHRSISDEFGTETILLRAGDTFVELVQPTRSDTAAGRFLDRHGEGGYLVIVQTDDWDGTRARLDRAGAVVTIAIERERGGVRASEVHLHPKGTAGVALALDRMEPPSAWLWAGDEWNTTRSADEPADEPAIVGVTIASRDPDAAASRWEELLGVARVESRDRDAPRLMMDGAVIDFSTAPFDRLVGIVLDGNTSRPSTTVLGTLQITRT